MFVCSECGFSQPAQGRCSADGTPLLPVGEDVLLGTPIGVYRVARLLGIGGMGRVYKAVHPAIGSRVAIKVLSRECSDRRDLVERFFSEAKAVNLIRHEGIVNVLDLAVLPDGRPYIIMEYLDGAPLSAIVEQSVQHRAALPLGGIARLAVEVLDALGAAHAKNIVHRDLKPDNIYVAPSGRSKVLDFGIAKLSDVTGTATRTGSLLGTPHYMSPEQAMGRVVDHRSDLYAIGVILFECATGHKPFAADALFDLLRMHIEAPPPSPRSLRPDMPPELEQVILAALAKLPDQRFQTAMAMSAALQHATAQLPPDQWRPLAPSARPASGGGWAAAPPTPGGAWAATPPVSWGPTWNQSQPSPMPSAQPSPAPHSPGSAAGQLPGGPGTPYAAAPGGSPAGSSDPFAPPDLRPDGAPAGSPGVRQVSTVSSGQVTQGARPAALRRSRAGLWLAVAGLVAGGAVAAVTLSGRGTPGAAQRADGSAGATGAVDTAAAGSAAPARPGKLAGADPWAASDPWAGSAPAGSAAAPHDGERDSEDDDAPDPGPAMPPEAVAQLDEMTRQLDLALRKLPPAQRKQLAPYKDLMKLPPRQRLKRLQELSRRTPGAGPLGSGLAEAPLPPPPGAPPPPPPGAPPPGPPSGPGGWVTSHAIPPPPGFDPERVDVTAFVAWAVTVARREVPDAQLIRIDANGVSPDGRANLKLASLASDHGSIDVRFLSPSRGKRDPSQPLGAARHDYNCQFRIEAEPDGVQVMPINFFDCAKEHPVPAPRCSFARVWNKAIQRKAPSGNAVGNVDYRSNGSRPVWYFAIGAGFDVAFSEIYNDDC
jgi:serine/threonine-protein kinase